MIEVANVWSSRPKNSDAHENESKTLDVVVNASKRSKSYAVQGNVRMRSGKVDYSSTKCKIYVDQEKGCSNSMIYVVREIAQKYCDAARNASLNWISFVAQEKELVLLKNYVIVVNAWKI